jgi:hypothetical protein
MRYCLYPPVFTSIESQNFFITRPLTEQAQPYQNTHSGDGTH